MVRFVNQFPDPRQALLDHGAALPFALDADDPVIADVDQDIEAPADVVAVDAVADGRLSLGEGGPLIQVSEPPYGFPAP